MACMYVCKLTCFRTGKSSGYFSETIHFELSADLGRFSKKSAGKPSSSSGVNSRVVLSSFRLFCS